MECTELSKVQIKVLYLSKPKLRMGTLDIILGLLLLYGLPDRQCAGPAVCRHRLRAVLGRGRCHRHLWHQVSGIGSFQILTLNIGQK